MISDNTIWFLLIPGALTVLGILFVRSAGTDMARKFRKLGTMTGMTKDQIIAKVGRPQAITAMPKGGQLLQWHAIGFHVAIRFDARGVFAGIAHESRS